MATYVVDGKDQLRELADIPQMEPGAPSAVILANEQKCAVAYVRREKNSSPWSSNEAIAIALFDAHWHYSGSPNEEALNGHPLYPYGLRSYAAYEVLNSSWIRALERINRVHPRHEAARFTKLRHFILTFHDSTFECIGTQYKSVLVDGSMSDALAQMKDRLGL